MKEEIWRKLIFNCVVNPLTAMTRMEVGWISDERLNPLKASAEYDQLYERFVKLEGARRRIRAASEAVGSIP